MNSTEAKHQDPGNQEISRQPTLDPSKIEPQWALGFYGLRSNLVVQRLPDKSAWLKTNWPPKKAADSCQEVPH